MKCHDTSWTPTRTALRTGARAEAGREKSRALVARKEVGNWAGDAAGFDEPRGEPYENWMGWVVWA